jgi:hypothetical protein
MQDRVAMLATRTAHAPHAVMPQPYFASVISSPKRRRAGVNDHSSIFDRSL